MKICINIRKGEYNGSVKTKREREMRMFPRVKRGSGAVHEEEEMRNKFLKIRSQQESGSSSSKSASSLTVWRKSLVMSCSGFTVFDSSGNLVYRVDNYVCHPDELVLMDASGKSLLTMRRRKKFGLVDSWFVYEGEPGKDTSSSTEQETPICCVKKHASILQQGKNTAVQAHVYRVVASPRLSGKRCAAAAFTVEGSYAQRMCKVLDECGGVVAEIKRKESFGVDIFQLVVHPPFDPRFAMALVLLLDQMFSWPFFL